MIDKILYKLSEEYPALTGLALFVVAALVVWGFFKWLDKTG